MRDAKGLVRVTIFAGLALMTASSAVRIAMAQEKGGGDVTGPYDYVSDWPLPLHADGWTWGSIRGQLIDSWAQNKDLFTEGAAHRPASVSRRRSRSAISTVSALHSQVAHKLGCRPRGAPPFYGACAKISFF